MSLFTEHAKTIRRMFYRLQYQGLVEDHMPRDLKVLNKVIQEYELEKWFKFDPKDESTYPEEESEYLVVGVSALDKSQKPRHQIASFYTFGSQNLIDKYGGKGYWIRPKQDFYQDLSFFEVTHWQPLPKPPSEVKK